MEEIAVAKSILHIIESGMRGFSKGQKRIAEYILQNYDKAAFMTASKLGRLVGVSESTVVRFASELGYDGYPSMQRALQEMIRSRLTSTQRIQAAGEVAVLNGRGDRGAEGPVKALRLRCFSRPQRALCKSVKEILQNRV